MEIEIFSDMVCPWCYIGKRRLDDAVKELALPVELVWRSFQLDPAFPASAVATLHEVHVSRYGVSPEESTRRIGMVTELAAEEGLSYRLDRALMVNTFDAHRLVHHAAAHGRGTETAELLMRSYAIEGRSIADPETLDAVAATAGIERLRPGRYGAEVQADRERARALGVSGVPTMIVDGRRALVSPTTDELVRALQPGHT
jgi:predicted DsbA family dithiol-disulfide isomerase